MKHFLEWSCLRSWMEQWLKYVKWYYMVGMDPSVSIDQFFDAPIVNLNWNSDRKKDLDS